MTVLLVGDIHLSDKPPSSCTDSYLDDLLDLLWQTADLANKQGVEATVWAGDVFHVKTPSRTSHRTVQRCIDVIKRYDAPLFIVPGNHDMQHDRLESVWQTQPLGVLYEAGARYLDGPVKLPGSGTTLYGVPWRQSWEPLAFPNYGPHMLMIAHAPLYPPGLELPYENIPAREWAAAMGYAGQVYYGHVHEAHRVWTYTFDQRTVTFCNAGAITRGSIAEHDLKRAVSVTLWDAVHGFQIVELDYKPASEVFRLSERFQEKAAQQRLDEFLDQIGQTTLDSVSIEGLLKHVDSTDLDADVVSVVKQLLEDSSAG